MQHFHINTGNEPEPEMSHWEVAPGTSYNLVTIGDRVKAVLRINVQFA